MGSNPTAGSVILNIVANKNHFGDHFQYIGTYQTNSWSDFVVFKKKTSFLEKDFFKKTVVEKKWMLAKKPEDLFCLVKQSIHSYWQKNVEPEFEKEKKKWLKSMKKKKIKSTVIRLLKQYDCKDELNHLGLLESIRFDLPEVWHFLLLLSSWRQQMAIQLLDIWLPYVPEPIFKKWGIKRMEIVFLNEISNRLGSKIDLAYLKQIKLADQINGSLPANLPESLGLEYLYDIYDVKKKKVIVLPYKSVFLQEWPDLIKEMRSLSLKAKRLINDKKLPQSYSLLSTYFTTMLEAYGCKSKKPIDVFKKYQSLNQKGVVLNQRCPLMVMSQNNPSVASQAHKVDVELRIGYRFKNLIEKEKKLEVLRVIAQNISDTLTHNSDYKIPQIFVNYQPYAFGPNLHWPTPGESNADQIILHDNIIESWSNHEERPLLLKFFNKKISSASYQNAALVETALHELGHMVIPSDGNLLIRKKIGLGSKDNLMGEILDELKAETVGMKILLSANPHLFNLPYQFLAKIGTLLNYTFNESGKSARSWDQYYYVGAFLIRDLLKENIIVFKKGVWQIQNISKGFEIFNIRAREVLDIYLDPKINKKDIRKYVIRVKNAEKDPIFRKFIAIDKKR